MWMPMPIVVRTCMNPPRNGKFRSLLFVKLENLLFCLFTWAFFENFRGVVLSLLLSVHEGANRIILR